MRLREDPDVLVLEDVSSSELVNLALDAAAAGRLVICGFPARSAAAAIDSIIDLSPPSERRRVEVSLAQNLRGVVAQVLLKKTGGGRLAARELLLNTPAVASLLAEGKTSQLPLAIEGGRKHGMVPLNDALGGFAQSGAIDLARRIAVRRDRPGLLATAATAGCRHVASRTASPSSRRFNRLPASGFRRYRLQADAGPRSLRPPGLRRKTRCS